MPYSNVEQIPVIINAVKSFSPRRVLDVGCGIGVYGLLLRIFLELYDDAENFLSKLLNQEWEVEINGIEGFSPYIDLIPRWAYNHVWNDDVFSLLPTFKNKEYDLSLAVAILEHFYKEDGHKFLEELKRISRIVVVSVPRLWGEQNVPENPLENHRSHWTPEDFKLHNFTQFLPSERSTIAVYAPDTPVDIVSESENKKIEKTKGLIDRLFDFRQRLFKLH